MQIQSLNHFSNGGITLSCQPAAEVTCAAESTPLSDGGTASIVLTVTPRIAIAAKRSGSDLPGKFPISDALACALVILLPQRKRRGRSHRFWGIMFLLVFLSAAMSCGGRGSTAAGGNKPQSQAVSVSVTASATTASGILEIPAGVLTLTVAPD